MSSSHPKKRIRAKVPPDKRQRTAQACVACRKRKRKCHQQKSGICAQCWEHHTTCYFETIPKDTDRPSVAFSCTTTKWQVPPAAQRQIVDEMKQLHPGLDMSFEVIQSAAMAMENYRLVGDSGNTEASPRGSREHTSNEDLLDDFPKTILQAVGKPMESPTPTGSLDDFDNNHEAISELLLELPPWSTANTLIEAFFYYGEGNWYYCDEARFRQRLTSLYEHGIQSDEATPGFVSLTFMALAMGSHFQHLPTPSKTYIQDGAKDNSRLLGSRYFDAAQKLHSHLMQHISIEGVQTTLLMALFLLPTGRRGSNYTFMGLSLRMAMALYLHRLAANANSLAEESRRVFWTVWCLEKRFSLTWRAPDMLREGEIATPMPVYDASLDAGNPSKLIRLRAFIDLTKLHSSATRKSTSASGLEDILELEQRLESWNRNLPDSLHSHELGHMRATVHLQIWYNLIWLDLGRTQLLGLVKEAINQRVRPTSDSAEYQQQRRLAKLCASSAQTVLRLIQSLRQVGMLASFSYTDFHACSAAVVLILLDSILHPRLGIADTVGGGIETLEMLATGSEYAQRGVTLVKRFCKMMSKVVPDLLIPRVNLAERPTTTRGMEPTASGAWACAHPMPPEFSMVDMTSCGPYGLVEDLTDTDPSSVERQYEAADFAALEAIMSTDSDLWDDDQTSQDLYFFGFDGVGPSLL